MLKLYYDTDAWYLDRHPSLKFAGPTDKEDDRFHAIITAKSSELLDKNFLPTGQRSRFDVQHSVDDIVPQLLSVWALGGLLAGFERYLTHVRDSTDFGANSRKSILLVLDEVKSHVAQSFNIHEVCSELNVLAKDASSVGYRIETFRPCNSFIHRNEQTTILGVLRLQIAYRSSRLFNLDRSVREIFLQFGNTLVARENIKLQKQMKFLTWIIIVLTVFLVISETNVFPTVDSGVGGGGAPMLERGYGPR